MGVWEHTTYTGSGQHSLQGLRAAILPTGSIILVLGRDQEEGREAWKVAFALSSYSSDTSDALSHLIFTEQLCVIVTASSSERRAEQKLREAKSGFKVTGPLNGRAKFQEHIC